MLRPKTASFIIFCLISIISLNAFPQKQAKIDSLKNSLIDLKAQKLELGSRAPEMFDTLIISTLNNISFEYIGISYPEAIRYGNDALQLSEQLNFIPGIAGSHFNLGSAKSRSGQFDEALEHLELSKELFRDLGRKTEEARVLGNIAGIFYFQGNYPKALKQMYEVLKIQEKIGDKNELCISYSNIGSIFAVQGNYEESNKNYKMALNIYQQLNDEAGLANAYGNLGNNCVEEGKTDEALNYYNKSLKIHEKLGDIEGIAYTKGAIGELYKKLGKFEEALEVLRESLQLYEKTGNKQGIAESYTSIGSILSEQGRLNEAVPYLQKSLSLGYELNSLRDKEKNYQELAKAYKGLGRNKEALESYEKYILFHDSIFNTENAEKIAKLNMQYAYEKKETERKAEQARKDILAEEELKKQRQIRNISIGGAVLMMMFSGMIIRQRNRIREARKISEEERKRSDELLLNILPSEVAGELKSKGQYEPKTYSMVTVLFADFKEFTRVSEKVSAELIVRELNACFSKFDEIIQKYKIEKIKTIGDAYMCASGLPVLSYTHAIDMAAAALEMREFINERRKEKLAKGEIAFELRIGIHTGPVVAGIVGVKKFQYDIWGDTVNLAARMEENCEPGNILISSITYEMIREKFRCTNIGKLEVKNRGSIDTYLLEGPAS